jgi:hypothetical protein
VEEVPFREALTLVLWEIRGNLKAAGRHRHRPITARGETIVSMSAIGFPSVTSSIPPSLEQRVAALAAQLDVARRDLHELPAKLREEWRNDFDSTAHRLTEAFNDRDNALEGVLLGVAGGHLWARILGTAAILVGLAVSTVGAVLA